MDTGQEDRLEALFEEALTLAPEQRTGWLAHACAGDPELRRRLEDLLAQAEQAQSFVDGVIGPALSRAADGLLARSLAGGQVHSDPLIGRQVAHYQISEKLGGGGMGVVYKAQDLKLGRTVALKFLPAHLCLDAQAKERFVQEAKAASMLDHPNICVLHGIEETETGQLFLVMAYYAGETLKAKIARGELPIEEAVDYTVQILEGLAAAHHAGIIHRDIKPANVLVTGDGVAKLVDFGLAKLPEANLTQSGVTAGTVAYMSPEQTRGGPVDGRTDFWSLGVVLYEMLTAARPFRGDADGAVVYAIRHDEAERVEALRPRVPSELAKIVHRCLAKVPTARHGSAAALLADLRAIARTLPENEAVAGETGQVGALPHRVSPGVSRRHHVLETAERLSSVRVYRRLPVAAFPVGMLGLLLVAGYALWMWARPAPWMNEAGAADAALLVATARVDPAIAVLRLQAAGDRGDRGWLAEALQVGIIDALSRSSGVVVRSREAVADYAAPRPPSDTLAKLLEVDFVVSGSVASGDDGVAVTVQLSNAMTGTIVTSRVFRVPAEPFALTTVEDVSDRVAEHLLRTLGAEVRVREWRAATTDPEAFRLRFLAADRETTAREFLRYRDRRAAERAYQEADSLLALSVARAPAWIEPRLARARLAARHAGLAIVDGQAHELTIDRFRAGIDHADDVLRREPDHGAALAMRGRLRWRLFHYTDSYPGVPRLADGSTMLDSAERDLRRALELDPSLAGAAAALSALLHIKRRAYGEGRVFAHRALELDAYLEDASEILHRIAMASHELGEDSTALVWCREGVRRFPDAAQHHACVLDVLAWGESPPEPDTAWKYHRRVLQLIAPAEHVRVEPYYTSAVASVLARSGLADSSRAVLDRVRHRRSVAADSVDQDGSRMLWLEAAVRLRLGETDSARVLISRLRTDWPETASSVLERRILRDYMGDPAPRANR